MGRRGEREREIVSLTSTCSHGRRLPTPHHLTRVLPPACHGRRRPSLLPFAPFIRSVRWRGAPGTCWRRAFRSRVFIGAWRRGLAYYPSSPLACLLRSSSTRLVALRRETQRQAEVGSLLVIVSHCLPWFPGFASSGMQPSPLSLLVFLF
jgi:hypothetical protein